MVVSNTGPLSELAKIGLLHLVPSLYGHVAVPSQVYQELLSGSHPAAAQLPSADWIEVSEAIGDEAVIRLAGESGLHWGECAAILLAEQIGAELLLIDELDGREEAARRGIRLTGSLGILLAAKRTGLIASVRQVMDQLLEAGTYIGPTLYGNVLDAAGERPA